MRYSPVKVKIIKRGLTLRDFARRAGLHDSIVRKTLDGTRHNRDVQEAVAAFLEEPAEQLFGADWWGRFERGTA